MIDAHREGLYVSLRTKFSHLDRLGTNAQTTNASGGVVDVRRYDAFGLPVTLANPTGSQQGFASAFGYQEDAESGLKLLGHRYYDVGTGRFITRDPAQDGSNWYVYGENNPLTNVDPTGESVWMETGVGLLAKRKNNKRKKPHAASTSSKDPAGEAYWPK